MSRSIFESFDSSCNRNSASENDSSPNMGIFRFFVHWCKGLFCASLVLSFIVSASSARVALVTLTVGLMALFICPGFPGLTSISSPNERMQMVFGCVGASPDQVERGKVGGMFSVP